MADQFSAKALTLLLQTLTDQSKADAGLADALLRELADVVPRLLGAVPPGDVVVGAGRDDDGDIAQSLPMNTFESERDDGVLQHIAAGCG